jgi:predicted nucleotidyltransferase/HEPN domain-containing protein
MKNSLGHLPKNKQNELQEVVLVICKKCQDVEKIILFGSYARGNYKEAKDLRRDDKTGHISDYDILVVTSTKEIALNSTLWDKISKICGELNLTADPRIITHDIEALNIKLGKGQYFYSDIKKEGVLLFDTKNFELAEKRDLLPEELQEIAQEYFDYWFSRAGDFFDGYEYFFNKSKYCIGAFNLHQAVESCYKTIFLVFDNYNPNEHFLKILGKNSEKFHPLLKNIFPKNTEEEKERFRLLDYSYIGGRYDPDYYISKEDLEILVEYVKKLLQITEEICKEKILSFTKS